MNYPMNIYSLEGDKVKLLLNSKGEVGGYEYNKQQIEDNNIQLDVEYTVAYTSVGSYNTDLYLVEFPGISFNSVNFYNVDESIACGDEGRDSMHPDWHLYNDEYDEYEDDEYDYYDCDDEDCEDEE